MIDESRPPFGRPIPPPPLPPRPPPPVCMCVSGSYTLGEIVCATVSDLSSRCGNNICTGYTFELSEYVCVCVCVTGMGGCVWGC